MRVGRVPALVVAAAAALATGGCGTTGSTPSASTPSASTPSASTPSASTPSASTPSAPSASGAPASTLNLLPPRAVAYLPSSLKPLTAQRLAREAGAPALLGDLRAWGYQAGAERYFQGESRRLQVVDSRTLRFRSSTGAAAFVRFVAEHPSPYLGSFASVRILRVKGRQGDLLIGQPCQCHLANPALLGIVFRGSTVTWLEINGPRATRPVLVRLMSQTT